MSELADLVQALQALQLDRFTGLPGEIGARIQKTEESPIRIAVVGPQSNLVLNCLVRDILFHETSLPTRLRCPVDAADVGVVFGRYSEPLEDAREWKPLQRATYLKKLRSKIDAWSAEKDGGKGDRIVIKYPFTNQFKPTAVELQNFREDADVVLDTWITRRATDGAEQLAISGTLGKFEGLQPRVALASAVAGMSSPELKFFDTMVARIIAPAVKKATVARAAVIPTTQTEATKAIQALRSTAETAHNLAAAIEKALGHVEQPTQLKRVPSSSASYSPPPKKVIQMQLTDKAPEHIVAAHSKVLPGTETVPPYTVESKTATPYVANDEPEPGWSPSQATWQPREPEWKPTDQPWQPKAADWKPKSDEISPDWQPKAPEWTPKQEEWKPKLPGLVKEQEWQPKSQTWRPADPSWKPQPPEWQEATEA